MQPWTQLFVGNIWGSLEVSRHYSSLYQFLWRLVEEAGHNLAIMIELKEISEHLQDYYNWWIIWASLNNGHDIIAVPSRNLPSTQSTHLIFGYEKNNISHVKTLHGADPRAWPRTTAGYPDNSQEWGHLEMELLTLVRPPAGTTWSRIELFQLSPGQTAEFQAHWYFKPLCSATYNLSSLTSQAIYRERNIYNDWPNLLGSCFQLICLN